MSCRSPLTVPMTTTPLLLLWPADRWGFKIFNPAFMAWAAMSISGTKSSPALKRSPTSSMALISPSFKIVPMSVPPSSSAWVFALTVSSSNASTALKMSWVAINKPPDCG
jgi:hypothetical protein